MHYGFTGKAGTPPAAVIPGNAVMSAGVAASQGSSLIRPLSRSTACDKVLGYYTLAGPEVLCARRFSGAG